MKKTVQIEKEYFFFKKNSTMTQVVKQIKNVAFEHFKDFNFINHGTNVIFTYNNIKK